MEWNKVIGDLNGFFAAVVQQSNRIVLVSDHIRSIPLFFATDGKDIVISDDANWVRTNTTHAEIDDASVAEILASGYVCDRRTMFDSIYQVPPGQLAIIENNGDRWDIRWQRYYTFQVGGAKGGDDCASSRQFDEIVEKSVDRLVTYAGGRQIIVPLSGGYDSRLIVLKLKQFGYPNFKAFTYGVRGSEEVSNARRIADQLHLDWRYIEYSQADWKQAWSENDRKVFQVMASGWSSLPHYQDWLALKKLTDTHNPVLNEDAVIAPGHGAMAILSHLKRLPLKGNAESLADEIWRRKYSLSPINPKFAGLVRSRVNKVAHDLYDKDESDITSAYAAFEWQERQSKYLANSVRMYEFFGFDWWMPLWDLDFIRFWNEAPQQVSRDKAWYKEEVATAYGRHVGNAASKLIRRESVRDNLYRAVARSPFGSIVRRCLPQSRGVLSPFAFEGMFSADEWRNLRKMGFRKNGMAAYSFLSDAGFNPAEFIK